MDFFYKYYYSVYQYFPVSTSSLLLNLTDIYWPFFKEETVIKTYRL